MKKLILLIALLLTASYSFAQPYYHTFQETTSNLGGNAVFTSNVIDVTTFKTVDVNVTASHNSASNGLKINFVRVSGDCKDFTPTSSNMDYTANGSGWSYAAGSKDSYSASVRGNCAWVTYTNSGTLQTDFKLTIFGTLR